MAKPNSFNDPFDCKPAILRRPDTERFVRIGQVAQFAAMLEDSLARRGHAFGLSRNEQKRIMRILKSKVPFEAKRNEYEKVRSNAPIRWEGLSPDSLLTQLQDELNEVGVFCLSARPDHMLMWAHYADQHTGFCLGFEPSPGTPLANRKYSKPVRYVDEYPQVDFDKMRIRRTLSSIPGELELESKTTIDWDDENLQNVLYCKSKQWEYEQEWRYVKRGGGCETPYPGLLRTVIFGLKCPNMRQQQIRDAVASGPNGKDVHFERVTSITGSFDLILEPVM
jgi:hypothetical protein